MSNATVEIAETIRRQIGHKALYMMGAKNLIASANGLTFKIMRNAKKVTHVVVTLNALDLYDIEFVRCNVRAKEMRKTMSESNGVYADSLHAALEMHTGLATSL